jgi:Restriction endonuclease
MSRYNFELLSPYDFELLAPDLLQAEFRLRPESFAKGRDGGIDFRFQSADRSVVVQCKHYGNFDSLCSVLKREEVSKLGRLKPARYILVVTTPLTPHRKGLLLELLSPHVLTESDILGKEDLENLLGLHPSVERKHIKLWLTSTSVLEEVLHGGAASAVLPEISPTIGSRTNWSEDGGQS